MTPALLQKIELLTLNQLELSDLINEEMLENPFLEDSQEEQNEKDREEENQEKDDLEQQRLDELEYEYFFGDHLAPNYRRSGEYNPDLPSYELFLADKPSLIDHLNWQLQMADLSEEIEEVCRFIIGNLDSDGYLTLSSEEICEALNVLEADIEEALHVVQHMDPLGVGSRSLQECLLVQMDAQEVDNPLAYKLVTEYLDLLEKKKFHEIARAMKCELDEIGKAMDILRCCCPKPGQKYGGEEPVYIRPDVYMYKVDDEYQIMLNDEGVPRLSLNRAYRKVLLKKDGVSKDTKSYVKERFRSAVELLRSIDQRQQTIFRVCNAIIDRQREFLEKGKLHLKPMLIKDIAAELDVHPSTISRVVANKYAYTPQGVIELRKFFTVGVERDDGRNVSTIHVKEKIRRIIEQEDPKKPFSDQKICSQLADGGIQITRRTVAKYRDQMNIPGSRERKVTVSF